MPRREIGTASLRIALLLQTLGGIAAPPNCRVSPSDVRAMSFPGSAPRKEASDGTSTRALALYRSRHWPVYRASAGTGDPGHHRNHERKGHGLGDVQNRWGEEAGPQELACVPDHW